jgi:hypothetical protein
MNDAWKEKVLKELAENQRQREEEIKMNPLSQYSISQLKEELRRRKGR